MRTKFITTVAAATLLTIGSTAAALAEAADVNATFNQDQIMDASHAANTQTPSNAGFAVHNQQLNGHRAP